MLIGYARTSTLDQVNGFDAQLDELKGIGCQKIFSEQVSSVGERPELEAALEVVREGDTFVVTKLDRLARSIRHLGTLVERLDEKKVHLRILNLGIDTASATGRLILTVLGGIAEFERSMMLERQREGIARAKAEGKYKGRVPTARRKAKEVIKLRKQGMGATEIAKSVGIGRASVYRILKGQGTEAEPVIVNASKFI